MVIVDSMITTATQKNMITIPAEIVRRYGIKPGYRLDWQPVEGSDEIIVQVIPDRASWRDVCWVPDGASRLSAMLWPNWSPNEPRRGSLPCVIFWTPRRCSPIIARKQVDQEYKPCSRLTRPS